MANPSRWRLRYAAWLSAPLALLGAAIGLEHAGGGWRAPGSDFQRGLAVADAKLRRTLGSFDAAGLLEIELAVAAGEGFPLELRLDPEVRRLIAVRANRERFKQRAIETSVRFGDGPTLPATLSLRGDSSLNRGPRPNYELDLLRPQPVGGDVELEKIFLMAMNEDPHQIVARFAYDVYRELGLYPTLVRFVRLSLSDEPQGLYLLLEPPRTGLRRVHPDTVAIHRRQGRYRYRTYWARSVPAGSASLHGFQAIRHAEPGIDAEEIERHLDLDAYLTYLAANSMLRNADTQAELFLYERRTDLTVPAPLRPMAWDPDDVGSAREKPGAIQDPLIYSSVDPFDRLIASDPDLRRRYSALLVRLLEERLTPAYLRQTLRRNVRLRDELDDGRPTEQQRAEREARTVAAEQLEERLLGRRAYLLAVATAAGPDR
jgi:hypothetical protein